MLAVIDDFRLFDTWISYVLVRSCWCLIQCSTKPFLLCALNPAKVSACDCFVHDFTHAWDLKIPLSARYALILLH